MSIIVKKDPVVDVYAVITYKVVKDKNDNDVEVVDNIKQKSVAELESEKDLLQAKIDEINEILTKINELNN